MAPNELAQDPTNPLWISYNTLVHTKEPQMTNQMREEIKIGDLVTPISPSLWLADAPINGDYHQNYALPNHRGGSW